MNELHSLNDEDKRKIIMEFADCCSDLIQDIADEHNLDFYTVLYIIEARVNLPITKPIRPDNTPPTTEDG